MFNIDWDKLIAWLLPVFMRRPVQLAWLKALCAPVYQMYNELMIRRSADLYELAHDGRVFSLTAMLNDRFDGASRRIYLTDGFTKDRIYLYTRDESKPLYLTPAVALYNPADYADTGVDFVVWVPAAVTLTAQDIIEMNAKVNQYKLAGKRFQIYRTA